MAEIQEKAPISMEKEPVANTPQVDEALNFLRQEGETLTFTAEDEKRLVRKIDWMTIPLMVCIYSRI